MKQAIIRTLLLGIVFIVGFTCSYAQLAKIGVYLNSGKTLTYEVSDNPQITYGDYDVTIVTNKGSQTYQMSQISKIAFINRVTGITLSMIRTELEIGQTLQLTATVIPDDAENKSLEWSSSNDKVAMVSSSGKVVALAEGQAVITAKAKDGSNVSASCTVTVTAIKVKSIELNHTSYALTEGESVTLEATLLPANAANKAVKWDSSDDSILMVNSHGTVFCLRNGSATITATTTDGSNLSASCVFNCASSISSVDRCEQEIDAIYLPNGAKTSSMKKGMSIVRMKDGSVRKQIK